ncbi:MAG: peptide deformylase [Candidatus Omnitrophota bacterium]
MISPNKLKNAETELKIRIVGDPVLRKKAKKVSRVTARHRDILSKMSRLMYEASGVGLAAPQVGIDEQMIVVDIGHGLYKLINPRIIKKEGRQAISEGCLSVPGVCVKVKRAKKIMLQAFDEDGKIVVFDAQDLLACVCQHEIDHLSGKLIIDYAPLWKRLALKRRLKKHL